MACMQVLGFDHAVSIACTAGQLELNTHMPLVGMNLIKSFNVLSRVCQSLAEKCVSGITADIEVCNRNFEISAGLATVLNPMLGYDKVAVLVKESLKTGKTLKELTEAITMWPQKLTNIRTYNKEILQDPRVVNVIESVTNELGSDGKVLVRASGTEPLIRVTISCETDEQVTHYTNKIVDIITIVKEDVS